VALYARVSTHDQKTLSLQLRQMRRYVRERGWTVALEIEDIASGAKERPRREEVLKAARPIGARRGLSRRRPEASSRFALSASAERDPAGRAARRGPTIRRVSKGT
jgi:predicted site-specific integrase-resolvase